MRKTTRQKIIEEKIYIANDGKEFLTEAECLEYEEYLEATKAAEKLEILDLECLIPINNNGEPNWENDFKWYEVKNYADFDAINRAYGQSFIEPENYPEIICVERHNDYDDESYIYYMSDMKEVTESFWRRLGYKVTFEKEENKEE